MLRTIGQSLAVLKGSVTLTVMRNIIYIIHVTNMSEIILPVCFIKVPCR
jgi:hypothetical protein